MFMPSTKSTILLMISYLQVLEAVTSEYMPEGGMLQQHKCITLTGPRICTHILLNLLCWKK